MKLSHTVLAKWLFTSTLVVLLSFTTDPKLNNFDVSFPYKKMGLTEKEAAAHLLNRFTFGATPLQIDAVIKQGLENWFVEQLSGQINDDSLQQMLSKYDALNLSNADVIKLYPKGATVKKMAIKDGVISKDSLEVADKAEYRKQVTAYMQQKGYRPQQELFRQLINQKILRASYSKNQLHEVLTDFWFNHFNVSITKNNCAEFIPAYERDVIRPNVLGSFENILLATAKSPAMLFYLDNFSSASSNEDGMMLQGAVLRKRLQQQRAMSMGDTSKPVLNRIQQAKKTQGLNENYAREVMELHTLGVDGGYTQQDVTQAARVLTGWTVYPMGQYGETNYMGKLVERIGQNKMESLGFVHEGDFLFAANRHDTKEKIVLGKRFSGYGGYQEGVELLKMLSHHKSTANFISRKLAIRFVNDDPPKALVDKMAKTFTETNGDIKRVLITMATSPEFWSREAIREKTKSPFELVISTVRATNAEVRQPYLLSDWMNKMGQKIYFYQAPTGFPDKSAYWINTGALLNRMNFGLAFAAQRIPGVYVNLLKLNQGHEPESAEDALLTFTSLILPTRNSKETIDRLAPLLTNPDLEQKIDQAAAKASPEKLMTNSNEDAIMMDETEIKKRSVPIKKSPNERSFASMQSNTSGSKTMLSQVVGIIIGSPEFQRR